MFLNLSIELLIGFGATMGELDDDEGGGVEGKGFCVGWTADGEADVRGFLIGTDPETGGEDDDDEEGEATGFWAAGLIAVTKEDGFGAAAFGAVCGALDEGEGDGDADADGVAVGVWEILALVWSMISPNLDACQRKGREKKRISESQEEKWNEKQRRDDNNSSRFNSDPRISQQEFHSFHVIPFARPIQGILFILNMKNVKTMFHHQNKRMRKEKIVWLTLLLTLVDGRANKSRIMSMWPFSHAALNGL